MTVLLAAGSIILGLAYSGYGVMTVVEMRRDWHAFGFSHFGAAWIAMAFTCGPHHLAHGLHLAIEGRQPGVYDLVAVAVGLPAGIVWLLLRIEAFAGGRGDRFIPGTPAWLSLVPPAALAYGVAMTAAAATLGIGRLLATPVVLPNILLVGIYMTIGWYLLRTQLANRPEQGGWSVSGVCLSIIFPTCALMHMIWAAYAASGRYHFDQHGFTIDVLAVPAGLYFLWVVRSLYRDAIQDWNAGPDVVEAEGSLART